MQSLVHLGKSVTLAETLPLRPRPEGVLCSCVLQTIQEICIFSDTENTNGDIYASEVQSLQRYKFCCELQKLTIKIFEC